MTFTIFAYFGQFPFAEIRIAIRLLMGFKSIFSFRWAIKKHERKSINVNSDINKLSVTIDQVRCPRLVLHEEAKAKPRRTKVMEHWAQPERWLGFFIKRIAEGLAHSNGVDCRRGATGLPVGPEVFWYNEGP